MSEQGTKKQSDTQFICKLCDMMQKYPKIINWSTDGKKMIIFNIEEMETMVLPQYFRHSNFPSFIRQLNMYDFHKLYKNNNQIAFKNQIFSRGNQKNYHFIHRKKKIKQQCLINLQFEKKTENILKRLKKQNKLSDQVKEGIYSLLEYKYIAYQNTKKIKQQLETVIKQLKDCRSKKISETIKIIKNQLCENLIEQVKMANDIDAMLQSTFLVKGVVSAQKQNKQYLSNQINQINSLNHVSHIGSQFQMPIFASSNKPGSKDLFFDCNRMRSRHSFVALPSHCGGFWSLNQINNIQPIFYSSPKLISQISYHQKTITKQQECDSQSQDSFIKGKLDEKELQQILKGQEQKKGPIEIVGFTPLKHHIL